MYNNACLINKRILNKPQVENLMKQKSSVCIKNAERKNVERKNIEKNNIETLINATLAYTIHMKVQHRR